MLKGTHKILSSVFETHLRWRLLGYVFGLTTVDFQRRLQKDNTGILIQATGISIERKPAESKESERKVRICIYVLWLVFDRAVFVFCPAHASFIYFVFVSEFL